MNDTVKNISCVGKSCTGCGACANACMKNCISMVPDDEGFYYPKIDASKCVDCKKCLKVCPAHTEMLKREPEIVYAATSKRLKETEKSSSGGMFYHAAKFIIEEKRGFVCAAVLEDDLTLHHILTDKMGDIGNMQGSKYIQSRIDQCYVDILSLLNAGTPVLFCGTPCQVAGVKKIAGESESLYTMDLICHGTPSSLAFAGYMKRVYQKNTFPQLVFREKNPHTKSTFALKDKDSKYSIPAFADPFYQSFMEGINYRESCYACPYAQADRVGDLTIGDSATWRLYDLPDEKVISTIAINTEKGRYLWEHIASELEYATADYQKEVATNKQLHAPVKRRERRDHFYTDISSMSMKELKKKYCPKRGFKTKLSHFVLMHTTVNQRKAFKRLVKR